MVRRFFALIALLFTSSWCVIAQNSQSIDLLLCEIHDRDQAIRIKSQRALSSANIDSIILYDSEMESIDSENQKTVFQILDDNKWNTELSQKAYDAIFLVVDHSGRSKIKKYLPTIKTMAEANFIDKGKFATLQDRYLMYKGKKQIYGTQTKVGTKNGKTVYYLWPIEQPENLDSLRLLVGLPSIDVYIAEFRKMGMELIWDKSLKVKEIKKQTATIITN